MSTKNKVLRILEDNQERHLSGAAIARDLGISRNAVWKAIEALRSEGYTIEAVTNKGYALSQKGDPLSPQSIERHLPARHPFAISVRKRIDSTNSEARRRALEGVREATVIVAEEQTAGKGRPGKSFYSPASTGLYLSIVLYPNLQASQGQFITCAAAVATARAIEQVTGSAALIKWVNDIYCDGKKVSGILTEGTIDMESGRFEHAVLGIGVNVRKPAEGFPENLVDVAGTICDNERGAVRSELAACILETFWNLYATIEDCSFYEEYRSRCFLIGKPIVITRNGTRIRAKAIDLTRDFKLVIELPDKTTLELPYGEVSTSQG
ncbi:biotin--[acetyl-CoA-carboxylase] ligase [Raoultibacter phocaeensis]|uniref:biotin--[acetyl-CoA-carboxylase] ligase n=1 Tax=Raoultibacter phocaeensis TaxID=2479841 RepID=UPI0011189E32|nr:biotin--[acetyl-CoA-carboxylase] ligase [Raoultibacter phocaeensis]